MLHQCTASVRKKMYSLVWTLCSDILFFSPCAMCMFVWARTNVLVYFNPCCQNQMNVIYLPNSKDSMHCTLLWLVSIQSDVEVLWSSKVSRVDVLGETMLHLAAECANEKAGLFLVNNGANCSAVNDKVSIHLQHIFVIMSWAFYIHSEKSCMAKAMLKITWRTVPCFYSTNSYVSQSFYGFVTA